MRRTAGLFLAILVWLGPQEARAQAPGDFRAWLEGTVWPQARAAGVGRGTFDRALARVVPDRGLPGIDLPGAAARTARQSEFRSPSAYFRQKNMADLARVGRGKARAHTRLLARIEAETGVPGRIVLAIWGRESGFGNVGSNHNAYEVLATRGFYGPDAEYFTGELVAALKFGQGRPVRSSWAGALGQPQMMPTSFLTHGADGDGDGRVDIWGSEADTLASIARFLADHEWQRGRDWGYEVHLPQDVTCALEGPDRARPIRDWAAMGISRISGRPFPADELDREGALLLPAGRYGPAFVVTPNFHVLKRYNRSDLYALYVGNVADRIAYGMGDFRGGWKRVEGLKRDEVAQVQRRLEGLGLDTGGTDGLTGYRTRRAIGEWQAGQSAAATCFPARSVLRALRG